VDAFSGDAGELMLDYDSGDDVTHLLGDVDGDGVADLGVELEHDHSSFANFVL
jgi:serralysin